MRLALAVPVVLALAGPAFAQAPAPAQPAPAAARQRPRAATQSTAVLTITVTDITGAVLSDVTVSAIGPVTREGITTAAGQVRLLGIRAGTYRLRFEREGFNTFEKEASWRAGTPAPTAEASLTPAPPALEPAPAAEPPAPAAPTFVPDLPVGQPSNLSVPDYIERNHISNKEPQKENLIGCSGGAQAWLWQVREPWRDREHESAELMLYVVGGEGTVSLNGGREVSVEAGTLLVIPRGTTYSLVRRGRAPAMYLLATLSGPPCAR